MTERINPSIELDITTRIKNRGCQVLNKEEKALWNEMGSKERAFLMGPQVYLNEYIEYTRDMSKDPESYPIPFVYGDSTQCRKYLTVYKYLHIEEKEVDIIKLTPTQIFSLDKAPSDDMNLYKVGLIPGTVVINIAGDSSASKVEDWCARLVVQLITQRRIHRNPTIVVCSRTNMLSSMYSLNDTTMYNIVDLRDKKGGVTANTTKPKASTNKIVSNVMDYTGSRG